MYCTSLKFRLAPSKGPLERIFIPFVFYLSSCFRLSPPLYPLSLFPVLVPLYGPILLSSIFLSITLAPVHIYTHFIPHCPLFIFLYPPFILPAPSSITLLPLHFSPPLQIPPSSSLISTLSSLYPLYPLYPPWSPASSIIYLSSLPLFLRHA